MEFTLRDLQYSILTILIEIKKICEKHKLRYILYGGSCLGAVRNKGFIHWDDDADIAMPREDYEKLIQLCKDGELGNDFFLQDFSNEEPHYYSPWIRIRKNNTLCVIRYHKNDGFRHLGVFVDIFPFDYCSTTEQATIERQYKKYLKAQRDFANKVAYKTRTIKSKLLRICLLPKSKTKLLKQRDCAAKGLTDLNNKKCILDFNSAYGIKKAIFPADLFDELIECTFEKNVFFIPKKYDTMLTIMYGDYMKLPPVEKRVAHMPEKIKL